MIDRFAERLARWQRVHGRHNLPWQSRGAYATWISEVMLQQTQVQVVTPYYKQFIVRFPSVQILANAPLDDVLSHWAGLGYYSRARNLHKAAQAIVENYEAKSREIWVHSESSPGSAARPRERYYPLVLD